MVAWTRIRRGLSIRLLNVTVVPSFTEWGQNVDKIVTGAGAVSASLYGDLQSCDTPRVYRITYAGGHNPE